MAKKGNPALIGAFVVGALTLAVVGITAFGSGRLFRETYTYVMYFDSDVNGLYVGAAVKFKASRSVRSRPSCSTSKAWPSSRGRKTKS